MAQYITKIKVYLESNSKDYQNERLNIEVQDDMISGVSKPFIKTWNVSGVAKPTDSQLNALESTANSKEALDNVLFKRRIEYLSWQEQLDKLYHDIDDGKLDKTGSWYKHIKAVKDANSKG